MIGGPYARYQLSVSSVRTDVKIILPPKSLQKSESPITQVSTSAKTIKLHRLSATKMHSPKDLVDLEDSIQESACSSNSFASCLGTTAHERESFQNSTSFAMKSALDMTDPG